MNKIFLPIIIFTNILVANPLNNLLEQYKTTSEQSLQTVDEKLGHVVIYSQKEIRLMQYKTLNDILKELPLINLNKNRYGFDSPGLSGTKTAVSGFFRFFIDDYEVSSVHTQSATLTWGSVPLDFIDHVEVYYGDSSFGLGNETGIYFIRMYTKSAKKENATELTTNFSRNENSQSITQSQNFENDWSYLLFANNTNINKTVDYAGETLQNNADKKFVYLDISNDTTNINIGYANVETDTFTGISSDATLDEGEMDSEDFFINVNKYFLDDKSLKASVSLDLNYRKYEETNDEGLMVVPLVNLSDISNTMPIQYKEDILFTKINGHISKTFNQKNHDVITAFNIKNKKYEVKNRESINVSGDIQPYGTFSRYDEETIYSLLLQDTYQAKEDLFFIFNAKAEKYIRSGYLENLNETLFRVGTLYTPFENFGLKSFYTQTYIPPTFYNIDFVDKSDPDLQSQKYNIFTLEGVYTTEKSKISLIYDNVKIKDFIYFTPVGFINIDHKIETESIVFTYNYKINSDHTLDFNYYTTKLSEDLNSSNKGGTIKLMGYYENFEYFSSLIYRNSYEYRNIYVKDSFDLSLGMTYNYSQDVSFSIKGENLLDKSTESLYAKGLPSEYFTLENNDRKVTASIRWVF